MFVKVTNGQIDQYPYTVGDLRRDNPRTSFPKQVPETTMASFGMYPVTYDAAPEYDPLTHRLEHSALPVLKEGKWVLTKTVVPLTQEQINSATNNKAAQVREKRNSLLSETDWMALSDVTMSAEMTAYRQALRDITSQEGFPYNVTWPIKP